VDAIVDLVQEVTGARLYAFYKDADAQRRKRRGVSGWVMGMLTMWQYSGKPGHILRRYFIR
jgi:hypothetical protein